MSPKRCIICTQIVKEKDLGTLPCKHVCHQSCLDRWSLNLTDGLYCPEPSCDVYIMQNPRMYGQHFGGRIARGTTL